MLVTVQVTDEYGDPIPRMSVDVILVGKEVHAREVLRGVHEAVVDTSEYHGTVELVVIVERSEFILSESTHHLKIVTPAYFVTSGLLIESSSVQAGETVAISVDVTNDGGLEGSLQSVLKINGVIVDEYGVTLEPDGSETVMFEYVPAQPGTFTVEIDGLAGTFTVVEPASFEVSNLVIEPDSVNEDESITISVDCSNVGGISGSYDVVLLVDGETEDTSTVTVDAGESTTVSFDVSSAQPGTYSVEIGDLTGSYTVNPQEPEPKPGGIPGFTAETVFMGILLGALILWISRR